MTTETTLTPQDRIEAATKELGLSLSYKFVPFSVSRNKDEKHKSLNWVVTLKRGSASFSTEYSAGCGYCPANSLKWPAEIGIGTKKYRLNAVIEQECETGFAHRWDNGSMCIKRLMANRKATPDEFNIYKTEYVSRSSPIIPKDADVIHSIVLDASVLDEPSFESWASNFGYDTDSRAAEAVYKACLDTALKLRAIIGDAGLRTLQEACQDY